MLNRFELYLNIIHTKMLDKYFEQQKEYICCGEGCSSCCEAGEYPFSQLEFVYAMQGVKDLSDEDKNLVFEKAKAIKKQKAEHSTDENGEPFVYECPFLLNKTCSIYKHRGIICRTHGLLFFLEDEKGEIKNKFPYCVYQGLNYSKVFDKEKKILSPELFEKGGFKTEPLGYNIGLKFMQQNELAREFGLEFGQTKALIDWF